MKYYIIAGEASGDLHASHLIAALREQDPEAQFRGFGGDLMAAQGLDMVRHYRDLAYMGVVQVVLHSRTILRGMAQCKDDIRQWQPDVVILVDYPGFNLRIASYVHDKGICPVFYYIAPKIWAWKENRIKGIKRNVDELFSILPFEVEFFENKHHFPIHYVGNPTLDEVTAFKQAYDVSYTTFCQKHGLNDSQDTIALLPGSRRAEIQSNLPRMLDAVRDYQDSYNILLASASSVDWDAVYKPILDQHPVSGLVCMRDATFEVLSHSTTALVTSGTAVLETALFNVPQVVCYNYGFDFLGDLIRRYIVTIPYISLVNLIANDEIVPELLGDAMNVDALKQWLKDLLPGGSRREGQLAGYRTVLARLGEAGAPRRAAKEMTELLAR